MKSKLFCFGLVWVVVVSMSVISPVHAISLATLKNSLSKFCIASPEACGTSDAPIFDTQKNSCVCYNSNYQQYDASQRKCVIKCPAGTYRFEATTGRCPAGFYIAGATAKCPAGSHQLVVDKRALKSYEFGGQMLVQSDCKSLNSPSSGSTKNCHPELVSGSIGGTRGKEKRFRNKFGMTEKKIYG